VFCWRAVGSGDESVLRWAGGLSGEVMNVSQVVECLAVEGLAVGEVRSVLRWAGCQSGEVLVLEVVEWIVIGCRFCKQIIVCVGVGVDKVYWRGC